MKKKEVLREKIIKNEYDVVTRYALEKWYNITKSGIEYSVEYIVRADTNGMGYFRIYKRLGNALKDTYVEIYLEEVK